MMARGTLLLALVIALAVGAHAGGKDRIWKGGDSKCYVPGCALCDPNDAKICQVCNNDFVLMADNTCQRAMAPNPKAKFCHGEPPAVANAQGWPKKCKFEKIGTTCMTVCRPGFTSATPVSAYCSVGGVWETTGSCTNQPTPSPTPTPSPSPSPAPVACPGTPETAENADPFTCSNGQLDDTCEAACAVGFEGFGAAATCTAAGWEVNVDCTAAPTGTCPAAPTADEAADVDSWINAEGGDCADVSTDGTCEGICAEGFEGTPVATCTEDGSWAIEGACTPFAEVNCPGLPEDSPNALAWADCTETGECTGVCADGTDGDTCEGVCTDPAGTDPYIFAVCGLGADGNFGWVVDDNCAGSRRRR